MTVNLVPVSCILKECHEIQRDQLEAIHCSIDHLLHCLSTFDQHGQATLVPRTYKAVPATELPTDPSEAAETNCFTLQDQLKL